MHIPDVLGLTVSLIVFALVVRKEVVTIAPGAPGVGLGRFLNVALVSALIAYAALVVVTLAEKLA